MSEHRDPEQLADELVADQVRRYAGPAAPPPGGLDQIVAQVERQHTRRRSGFVVAAAAALVVIAGSVAVGAWVSGPDDRADGGPAVVGDAPRDGVVPRGGEWRPMAPSPLSPRHGSAATWTGTELVVVGGLTGFVCPPTADCSGNGEPSVEATAYDPATDTWRRLPDAPVPVPSTEWPEAEAGTAAVATWTGDEVAVVLEQEVLSLDPTTGQWRRQPITDAAAGTTPTVDDHTIVHASYDKSSKAGARTDWVLDPRTGVRTWLPPDPFGESYDRSLAWDGERFWLLSMAVEHHFAAHEGSPSRVAVLEGDRWRIVDEETPELTYGQRWWWDGAKLVVAPAREAPGRRFDPASEEWTLVAAPDETNCPLPAAGVGPDWVATQGGALIALGSGEATQVPDCSQTFGGVATAVWADDELLVWGGSDPKGRVTAAGLRWRPPAPR